MNYEAAIQAWTLPLPDGYEWPENVPRDYPAGGSAMSGEQIVRSIWGCAVIDHAWALYPTAPERAEAQLDLLNQDTMKWDLPYYQEDGWTDNARTAGDSGLCLQWINLGHISYP